MNGAVPGVRSVIVQHQVIGALYVREAHDGFMDPPGKFRIIPFSEDPGNCIPEHFDTGFDDYQGDDRAEPGFQ